MFKPLDSVPWALLAIATGGLSMLRLAAGEASLPAMVVCAIAILSALHRPTRETVVRGLLRLLSGSAIRSLVIVIGAVLLIQLLPLEMGLLLAGDILVYLEAVAAVGLIAANTRLRPLVGAMRARVGSTMAAVRNRPMTRVRQPGAPRRPKPPNASDDPRPQIWAFA
ncbi:MAG: hypothetical protein EON89_05375 [Brevundimonas sp.]|nr:MAG: hypothetical protein EON89_05375 [Brevundimonas sp.]